MAGFKQRFISRRIAAYTCCYGAAGHARMMARSIGDNGAEEAASQQMLLLDWALRVLRAYEPTDADDFQCCMQWSSTYDDVCCAVRLADPCCVRAGCPPTPTPSCDIVPHYTVLGAIASGDLPLSGDAMGDSYYIVSGSAIGNIYEWDGASWLISAVPLNQVVLDDGSGLFWTNLGAGPGLLFPEPLITLVSGSTYSVAQATTNTASGRIVRMQVLGVNGWLTVGPQWTEDQLPQELNLEGITYTELRFVYEVNGCKYTSASGDVVPPVGPCLFVPAHTAAQTVDANMQGLLADGVYFIVSDAFSMGNLYSAHVGELVQVPGDTFTPLAVGETVYDILNDTFWQQTLVGPSPLFIPVTITQTLSSFELTSDYPSHSEVGSRWVAVEVLTSNGWVIFWSGYEYDLPQSLPLFTSFTEVQVTYVYPDGCLYTAPGTFVPATTIDEPVTCGTLSFGQFLLSGSLPVLPSGSNAEILYTADLGFETLVFTFISGTLPDGVCFLFFDGPLDGGGSQFASLCGPSDLNGQALAYASPTNQILVLINIPEDTMFPDQPLWWQVGCATGNPVLAATVTPVDNCLAWEFSLDVSVSSTGSGATLSLGYSVDGGAEQIEANVPSGVTTLGPFPYNSEVVVRLISDEPNPSDDITLGVFTSTGECEVVNDPCAPDAGYKVNGLGDLADLPDDPGLPSYGYFVTSDITDIGTWPVGSLLGWDDGTGTWFDVSYTPGIVISNGFSFWLAGGLGFQPYEVFPVPELTPTGNGPLNWTIYAEEIENYNMSINTPFTLQVRNGFGPWQNVMSGTLQQMIVPYAINIYQPFTQARILWYYIEDCPFVGGATIAL